jgi:hypothetical protein
MHCHALDIFVCCHRANSLYSQPARQNMIVHNHVSICLHGNWKGFCFHCPCWSISRSPLGCHLVNKWPNTNFTVKHTHFAVIETQTGYSRNKEHNLFDMIFMSCLPCGSLLSMSQIYFFPLQQKTTFDLHGPGHRSQHDIQTVPGRSQCQGKDFLDLDGLTVND